VRGQIKSPLMKKASVRRQQATGNSRQYLKNRVNYPIEYNPSFLLVLFNQPIFISIILEKRRIFSCGKRTPNTVSFAPPMGNRCGEQRVMSKERRE